METCAWKDGCTRPKKPGKSKYCYPHATEARTNWQTLVADQAAASEARKVTHQTLFDKAHAAGQAAAEAKVSSVVPMIVEKRANPWDDNSPVVKSYYVPSGVCGFAWVSLSPGNSSFALWAVKNGKARKAYQGGVNFRAPDTAGFEQSMEVKEAYVQAFAGVLREAGFKRAYPVSRMD